MVGRALDLRLYLGIGLADSRYGCFRTLLEEVEASDATYHNQRPPNRPVQAPNGRRTKKVTLPT